MKHLSEYRDPIAARKLLAAIDAAAQRPWVIMEICGGQTHAIVRHGIDRLLPPQITLVHGPGCPVCVTPLETIDRAHAIAARPDVVFCSFGDMLRVPGSRGDLLTLKAAGADVRTVYSPLDALAIAERHPDREVVFFAIGFETTAPANAASVFVADERGIDNFSVLVSHVLVPPAIRAILEAPDNRVQGFLGPGHVCTVMGSGAYRPIAAAHRVPIVITGFEPVDILAGLLSVVESLEAGRAEVVNAYGRAVRDEGNPHARAQVERVFEICDRKWRGVGTIARSGLGLRARYARFDAAARFDVEGIETAEPAECISGQILRGVRKPSDCPAFGTDCTPDHPLGATMVSAEGACAAYHAYRAAERLVPLRREGHA